jgi:hypothetical protein
MAAGPDVLTRSTSKIILTQTFKIAVFISDNPCNKTVHACFTAIMPKWLVEQWTASAGDFY